MDIEKKMEEFDAELAKALTEDERADVIEKIAQALDEEMRKAGMPDEEREDRIAEIINQIVTELDDGDLEPGGGLRNNGELDT